jgi:hypothetical protein
MTRAGRVGLTSVLMESAADFALMVFEHTEGGERAYSNAADRGEWAREVAFVEHHRHDRIVVRGTFAGHYVDADDDEQFIGSKTAEGALGGAATGGLFGPMGLAVGLWGRRGRGYRARTFRTEASQRVV